MLEGQENRPPYTRQTLPYGVKMHCRLQRVQTAVHIKIRLVYTHFVIDYQLLLRTKCRVQAKQQKTSYSYELAELVNELTS